MNNRLEKNLSKYEYISFDIFDTLVKRLVISNKDVYRLTANLYEKKYLSPINTFVEDRSKIELLLWNKTSEGLFTIDKIYEELEKVYDKSVCERLKDIELYVEKTIIERNEIFVELFSHIVVNHRVILISDMYLTTPYIESILHNLKIEGYIKLYISGEKNCTKADGKLFNIVGNELKNKNIVHIGDSIKGDYIAPRLNRWKSQWIRPYFNHYYNQKKCNTLADSLLVGIINNRIMYAGNYWENVGFSILGPILLVYTKWIESNLKKENINTIVFLARDGYIVKQAFDLIFPAFYVTKYMYISRKSALLSATRESDLLVDIVMRFKYRYKESYRDVLCKLGVPSEVAEREDDIVMLRKDIYAGRYKDKFTKYYSLIKNKSLKQRMYLSEYSKEIFSDKKVAIVDIGWHGTIQDCLQAILGDEVNITGYYLGLERAYESGKEAFFSPDCFNPNMIPFTRGVFETFFSANHPSTDGYKREKKKIVPTYLNNKVSSETVDKINAIQNGAINFIEKYLYLSKKLKIEGEELNSKMISNAFLRFCNNPSYLDVKLFGNIEFNDTSNRALIDYKSGSLIRNVKAFINSDWKAGYAKRLFKVNLPYGTILSYINNFRRKEKR